MPNPKPKSSASTLSKPQLEKENTHLKTQVKNLRTKVQTLTTKVQVLAAQLEVANKDNKRLNDMIDEQSRANTEPEIFSDGV